MLYPLICVLLTLGSRASEPDPWLEFEKRAVPGHSIELLEDGAALKAARLGLVESAVDSIYVSVYALHTDEGGQAIMRRLCEKARTGVDVRLLLDENGTKDFDQDTEWLRACGARVLVYNPLDWGATWIRQILHEKLLIVDGLSFITGGSNYGTKYDGASFDSGVWHDLDAKISGPAACWHHYRFELEWKRTATMDLGRDWALYQDEAGQAFLERRYGLHSFRPCRYVSAGDARVYPLEQDPLFEEDRWILKTHIQAIKASRHSIRIYSPYFTPHGALVNALLDARRNKVEVTVITNSALSDDDGTTYLGMIRSVEPLLRAGVKVYLWNRRGLFHRKGALFDDRWAFVGSDNLDRAAHVYNVENVAYTNDSRVIQRLSELFDRDLAASQPLTLALRKSEYDRHSWWTHLKIWFVSRYL